MDTYTALLEQHTAQEEKRFESLESSVRELGGDIRIIKENHLAHIGTDIASLKTDVGWVKWGILAVLGALVAGSIGLIFIK